MVSEIIIAKKFVRTTSGWISIDPKPALTQAGDAKTGVSQKSVTKKVIKVTLNLIEYIRLGFPRHKQR